MADVTFQIEGLEGILRRADNQHLLTDPLRNAFKRVGVAVSGRAKELAPVDRGQLRAGIGYIVDFEAPPQWVEIGTRNLPYARAVHEGRPPGIWPPYEPIAAWVRRKGLMGDDGQPLDPFLVQRAIFRKGIKARPFLTDALQDTEGRIQGFFDTAAKEIEGKWQT
jgi:hypothetical protein